MWSNGQRTYNSRTPRDTGLGRTPDGYQDRVSPRSVRGPSGPLDTKNVFVLSFPLVPPSVGARPTPRRNRPWLPRPTDDDKRPLPEEITLKIGVRRCPSLKFPSHDPGYFFFSTLCTRELNFLHPSPSGSSLLVRFSDTNPVYVLTDPSTSPSPFLRGPRRGRCGVPTPLFHLGVSTVLLFLFHLSLR